MFTVYLGMAIAGDSAEYSVNVYQGNDETRARNAWNLLRDSMVVGNGKPSTTSRLPKYIADHWHNRETDTFYVVGMSQE